MQVKGTQVGGGSGKVTSQSRDNSAYWQAAKDKQNQQKRAAAKPTGGNSGNDYNAAEQARLEAQRKKEIEENRKYIKDIQETQGEIKKLRDQISEAKALLANAVSGEKYNEYVKDLKEQDKCLAQMSSDLNECAKQAAINIRKRGAECIFCEKNTEPAHNTSRDNNKTLSVNTDELKKVAKMLGEIDDKATSIYDKVTGIAYDSQNLGIKNSDNSENKSRNVVDKNRTLQDKLQQLISETERTEKENLGIVDQITDWFSNVTENFSLPALLTKWTGKEITEIRDDILKKTPSVVQEIISRKYGSTFANIVMNNTKDVVLDAITSAYKLVPELRKKQNSGSTDIKDVKTDVTTTTDVDAAREEHITIRNNVKAVKKLAEEQGIDTKGKSYKELIYELVDEYGIDSTKTITTKHDTSEGLEEWRKDFGANHNPPEADIETRYYDINDPQNKNNMGGLWNNKNGKPGGLLYKLGYRDMTIKVREDGVFIASGYKPDGTYFKDKVIVATDTYDKAKNPDGLYKRGTEVMTSLGPGIVLDYGAKADEYYQDELGIIDFEIATAWKLPEYYDKLVDGTLPVVEWEEKKTAEKTESELLDEIRQKAYGGTKEETATANKGLKDLGTEELREEKIKIKYKGTATGKVKELASNMGIKTKGKSLKQILEELADTLDIPIPEESQESQEKSSGFGETIWINQLDYLNVGTGLCGVTSLCMLASAALGRSKDNPYTPEDLYRDFPYIDKYRDSEGGFGDGLFKDEAIMKKLNLKLENENGNAYYWEKAWNEGLLMESLEEGKRAIWCTKNKTFTDSGHYIELELKDGKIWLNDPNGENYDSMEPTLKNILTNGCTPEEFKKYGGRFYIFDVANSEESGKTYTGDKYIDTLIDEVLNEGSQVKPTAQTTPTTTGEKVTEIPLYDQRDYADVSLFGRGNLAEDGCGIFAYSEVLQYLLDDPSLSPEEIAKRYEGTYSGDWGTSGKLFDETPQDYGLTVEKYYPWEGWIKTDTVQTALKNGQPVIAYVGPKTGLTGGGHYVVLTGMTEDGKVLVNDSNGANYEKSSLKDKYENGFDIETFSTDPDGGFWIFPSKETVQSGNKNNAQGVSTDPTTQREPTKQEPEKSEPTTPTKPTTPDTSETPTTPTKPTTPTTPTKPTTPTTPTKPTTPETPETPTTPSIPDIDEPEDTEFPVMQCTPEAILKVAQNIENTENNSIYICNILYLSGYFTEEEMNMYKNLDINEICKKLDERGWDKITSTSDLKIGDIIIINNGEEIRVYDGNNSWNNTGETDIQKGNSNWTDNVNWEAYRPD